MKGANPSCRNLGHISFIRFMMSASTSSQRKGCCLSRTAVPRSSCSSSFTDVVGLGLLTLTPHPDRNFGVNDICGREKSTRATRTGDKGENAISEARIDEYAADLSIPLTRDLISEVGIDVVWPFETNAELVQTGLCRNCLDHREADEILYKNDTSGFGLRQAQHKRELKASSRGDPCVPSATATRDLMRGGANRSVGEAREKPVVPVGKCRK